MILFQSWDELLQSIQICNFHDEGASEFHTGTLPKLSPATSLRQQFFPEWRSEIGKLEILGTEAEDQML